MDIALSPALRRYVDRQVKKGRFADAWDLVQAGLKRTISRGGPITARFGVSGNDDIMAAAFLILMEAAKSAREDLESIMERIKAINEAKRALRELLAKLKRDLAANAGRKDGDRAIDFSKGLGSERAYHRVPVPHADPKAPAGIRFTPTDLHPGKIGRLTELESIVDEMRDRLDSMSELGEMESLRLQMVMDRLSKFMTTLSNLLKKMSETASNVIQNIK